MKQCLFEHYDFLEELSEFIPLQNKLIAVHNSACELFPFITRISIALFDQETKFLKTFLCSGNENPLHHYQVHIDNAPSLKQIRDNRSPRVVNSLLIFGQGAREHTKRIARKGYAASYTKPIFNDREFIGFIFFNSNEADVFTEKILHQIDIYGQLIAFMVIKELISVQMLAAAIKTTSQITHFRDPETGSHLNRMSRYSQFIANGLASKHDLDDNYIEHIFLFSPLHDIGKISIPDHILHKPGKLDDDEMEIMKDHTVKGGEIIDTLLTNFGLTNLDYIDVLRNIAVYHHEAVNGSGYPEGLKGDSIPLEARIVAVADIFDALTSQRPYKEAWSNAEAIRKLQQLSGITLDRDCVIALLKKIKEIEKIQSQFQESDCHMCPVTRS